MTLSGATTPGQSKPGSDGNKEVLCILQSSSITGASPSDCLVSYPGHSLRESYPSAGNSVYSAAPADLATKISINVSNDTSQKTMETPTSSTLSQEPCKKIHLYYIYFDSA